LRPHFFAGTIGSTPKEATVSEPMTITQALGVVIKRRRIEAGLGQPHLCGATEFKVNASLLSRYESGKVAPKIETAVLLAVALGAPLSALIAEAEAMVNAAAESEAA
jgi:transcriptional regulator with XRE-family HTH domain